MENKRKNKRAAAVFSSFLNKPKYRQGRFRNYQGVEPEISTRKTLDYLGGNDVKFFFTRGQLLLLILYRENKSMCLPMQAGAHHNMIKQQRFFFFIALQPQSPVCVCTSQTQPVWGEIVYITPSMWLRKASDLYFKTGTSIMMV